MTPERKAERAAVISRALNDTQMVERFRASFDVRDDGCWAWRGTNVDGYGVFHVNRYFKVSVQAHRFAYELFVGAIPDGLVIDHVCHNRDLGCSGGPACLHRKYVNPAHLEPVTHRENLNRSPLTNHGATHCPHGHAYDEANTFVRKNGKRECRVCRAASSRRYYERQCQERSAPPPGHRSNPTCPHGHLFTEENTRRQKDGKRRCRECGKAQGRARREAEKALKSSAKNGGAYPGNQNSITDPGEATAPPAGALARRTDKEPFNA